MKRIIIILMLQFFSTSAYCQFTGGIGDGFSGVSGFFIEFITVPTLSTNNISNITHNSATSGGNITNDGGADVIARGVCWSTSPNPTIADNKTSDGDGLGQFTIYLTDLEPKSTYYVRAYATTLIGTAYGDEKSFSTLADTSNMKLLSFQGILKNAQGNFVANGDYTLTFRIYRVQSGGTAIWTETQTVNVKSGLFNTELGLINKLDLPFDTSYWLSIQVSNDSAELTPRRRLTGAIYNSGFGK